jgi:hypothetical protein
MIKKISFLFFALLLFVPPVVSAKGGDDPLRSAKLPNGNWTWKSPDKDEPEAKTMYVKKTGEAVSIRINNYIVPISSAKFLESVREQIMLKPDYAGAEVQLVKDREVAGKTWDVFGIKRKDEINQEIWGRKVDGGGVFMVIYTGAGTYYTEYYSDFMTFIRDHSK